MNKVELIKSEIDKIPAESLDEVYELIKKFTNKKHTKGGILAKLKQVKIEAPEDFASNIDLYLTGEKKL